MIMLRLPSLCGLAALCALLGAPSAASACPEKVPAGMQAVSVAESVAVGGMEMAILQVSSRETSATLLARMEKEWREAGFDVKRNAAQGWQVVSALSEKCLTTLQLNDQGGASGYLAINRFAKVKAARLPQLELPGGAKVLSHVLSDDDGRRGSTTVLASGQSVAQLASFYKQLLEQDRWSGVRAMSGMGDDHMLKHATVSAQRGRERVEVVIVHDNGAKVIVNVATEL